MDRYFLIVKGAGTRNETFYVVAPTQDKYDGIHIGTMFVSGRQEGEFKSLHEAIDFIRDN